MSTYRNFPSHGQEGEQQDGQDQEVDLYLGPLNYISFGYSVDVDVVPSRVDSDVIEMQISRLSAGGSSADIHIRLMAAKCRLIYARTAVTLQSARCDVSSSRVEQGIPSL
jgi:hypothetical protein